MAGKKSRCYSVTCRNGHGTYERIIPAQSGDDLANKLHVPSNDKLIAVKHLGHHIFYAEPDLEESIAIFSGTVDGKETTININDTGYEHLEKLLAKDVKAITDGFNSQHDEP